MIVSPTEQYSARLREREAQLASFDRVHARIGSARLAIGASFLITAWLCFGHYAREVLDDAPRPLTVRAGIPRRALEQVFGGPRVARNRLIEGGPPLPSVPHAGAQYKGVHDRNYIPGECAHNEQGPHAGIKKWPPAGKPPRGFPFSQSCG